MVPLQNLNIVFLEIEAARQHARDVAVTLRGGLGNRLGDSWALVVPQPIQFIPQPLGSFGSDVFRAGQSGGAIS